MKKITVELGERSYDITIGTGSANDFCANTSGELLVFDDRTFELYASGFASDAKYKFSFGRG